MLCTRGFESHPCRLFFSLAIGCVIVANTSVAERGVVWEETIILLPDNVHYVFLSATIPNATQFAEWICHLHKQVCLTSSIPPLPPPPPFLPPSLSFFTFSLAISFPPLPLHSPTHTLTTSVLPSPSSVSPTLPFTLTLQAQRLHEKKEHSTSDQVMDPKTRLMLFKMVDNEVLSEINGCVSTGKEACVFHAGGGR